MQASSAMLLAEETSDVSTPFAHEAIAGCFRALLFFVLCLMRNNNKNHFAVGSVIAVTHVKPLWATASAPTLSLSHITRNPPVHFPPPWITPGPGVLPNYRQTTTRTHTATQKNSLKVFLCDCTDCLNNSHLGPHRSLKKPLSTRSSSSAPKQL